VGIMGEKKGKMKGPDVTLHVVTFHLQEDVGLSKKQNAYSFEKPKAYKK